MLEPKYPNLFIIGAMKSGTSSLHYYLNAHPDVFMCEPKEPCYFVEPQQLHWNKIRKLKLWQQQERYLDLFQAAGEATIRGEASTLYTKVPQVTGVPERIAKFNPEARFIYLMRDPIERTISHYWHEVRRGNEFQEILSAVQNHSQYREVSYYAQQLRPYFERFSSRQILTLTFEEMVAEPQKIMHQVFAWLGVDADFEPSNLQQKAHVTPRQFYQKGRLYRLRYTSLGRAIASCLPKSMRSAGLRLAVKEVNRDLHQQNLEAVKDFLRPIQQAQTQELSQMLEREFPQWKTLYRASSFNCHANTSFGSEAVS